MKRTAFVFFIFCIMTATSGMAQKAGDNKQVKFVIHTQFGDMKGVLYNETPKHRDNFVKLVKQGYYDGLLFHRVIKGFMIQGGDPDSRNAKPGQQLGMGGPGYTIDAEINPKLIHKKGALSAARLGDAVNPKKASSGSQFYIVQGIKQNPQVMESRYKNRNYTPDQMKIYETIGGTPGLDGDYTVFGEITEGLEIIDNIATVDRDRNDRPDSDLKMRIEIIE